MKPEEIIEAMRVVAPPGQDSLSDTVTAELRGLTGQLITAKGGATGEYERFREVSGRSLCLPTAALTSWLQGKMILVTGGTGCVGSALLGQIARLGPARMISVSRGVTSGYPRHPAVEYVQADIRKRQFYGRASQRHPAGRKIFHVAAQRNPGVAEVEVHRTVTTNVLGTRNVLAAAGECWDSAGGVRLDRQSHADLLLTRGVHGIEADRGVGRLHHVRAACDVPREGSRMSSTTRSSRRGCTSGRPGGDVVRLHSTDIVFYVQSALESAQLLLVAGLGAVPETFRVHAITNLGWPVSLLDLTVGVLARTSSGAPVYISGYDRGYEEIPFPALYDPATAGEVSPLLNAFEAATAGASPCPMVDSFPLQVRPDPEPLRLLTALEKVCEVTGDADAGPRCAGQVVLVTAGCHSGGSPRPDTSPFGCVR